MLVKENLNKKIKNLRIKGLVKEEEILKKYTTLKIGGVAEIFVEPFDYEDIRKLITFATEERIPYFILGGGSKLLFPDEKLKGVVINLNNSFFKRKSMDKNFIRVECGLKIAEFLEWMLENSLGNWEFLAGIPGTMGGAICLNAGVRKSFKEKEYFQIGDFVLELMAMDKEGKLIKFEKKDLKFSYRRSNLDDFVILEITLMKGERKSPEEIKSRMREFLNYRSKTQDLEFPSAGCVFKNPLNINKSSGELIELSGLKGERVGDSAVSCKHANFFINLGNATAKDFLSLMEYVQKKVKRDHDVFLEPEIRIVKNQ